MKRITVITLFIFLFFLMEFLLFNLGGQWLKPHLLILLIIFFSLYLGIRFGIYTAVVAGILKDSFSISVFGLNVFTFVVCAYMTIYLRKYVYIRGSQLSRWFLVLCICLIDFSCRFILNAMLGMVNFSGIIQFVFIPGVVTTLVATTFTFQKLKQCVLKLSV